MNVSRDAAHSVVGIVALAETSLVTIAESVSQITEMNAQIANSAEEHMFVSEEIKGNIVEINVVVNETTKYSQQNLKACEVVALLSTDLSSLIEQYKV
jgi:methyl-accepting chemotaxis protein